MIMEMFIENYPVDVSKNLASLITYAIDDIRDFASRSTSFSKTIVLPGTANNNKLMGNVFEVGISNDFDPGQPNVNINFNPSVSANCLIFQDNIQAFKGTMRVLQVNIDRGKIDYEVAVTGELGLLNVRLTSGLLEDLDFSAYNENWNETNIVASWDNPGGSGLYYPLIDYGTYSTNKRDWDFRTMRPALYVKEYIDKMFEAADFRYSCALFDTARFKSLIIPHNQKDLTKLSSIAFYSEIIPYSYSGSGILNPATQIAFADVITAGDFTPDGPFEEFTYSGADIISDLSVNIAGIWDGDGAGTLTLYKNSTPLASVVIGAGGSFNFFTKNLSADGVALTSGDVLRVDFNATLLTTAPFELTLNSGDFIVNAGNLISVPLGYDEEIDINQAIPKNIRQIDFLVSIVKLFNLYVYEDRFDNRLLYITPYVDFYSTESQNAVDWTYKLDRSKPVSIKPMSEINAKIYKFNYAEDSDYYNELYEKRYNQTYGSHIYDTQFEFTSNTENIELIFAGTPLVGYTGEDKVYPTIFKLNDNAEERTDSVIRIMQTLKVTGVTSWNIMDDVSVLTSVTDYGYAGHFDNPDNVANDLNFGAVQELFFVLVVGDLTVTQFNVYWSPYMAEITDKDSKLLTGKFYLTPKDILDLDFSKYVNIDGNLFRLNKIQDYNLSKPDLCTGELLKVINTLY